jgi:hypothetical protein
MKISNDTILASNQQRTGYQQVYPLYVPPVLSFSTTRNQFFFFYFYDIFSTRSMIIRTPQVSAQSDVRCDL